MSDILADLTRKFKIAVVGDSFVSWDKSWLYGQQYSDEVPNGSHLQWCFNRYYPGKPGRPVPTVVTHGVPGLRLLDNKAMKKARHDSIQKARPRWTEEFGFDCQPTESYQEWELIRDFLQSEKADMAVFFIGGNDILPKNPIGGVMPEPENVTGLHNMAKKTMSKMRAASPDTQYMFWSPLYPRGGTDFMKGGSHQEYNGAASTFNTLAAKYQRQPSNRRSNFQFIEAESGWLLEKNVFMPTFKGLENFTPVPLYWLENGGAYGRRCIHADRKASLKSPDSDYLKVLYHPVCAAYDRFLDLYQRDS